MIDSDVLSSYIMPLLYCTVFYIWFLLKVADSHTMQKVEKNYLVLEKKKKNGGSIEADRNGAE